MSRKLIAVSFIAVAVTAMLLWLFASPTLESFDIPRDQASIDRGEYLLHAGGCISCHLNPQQEDTLSGGLALSSDFGTFYVPNITPDPTTGIGSWRGEDFIAALRHGRSPNGSFYFPAFPYRAYSGVDDEDVLAIAAYLMSQPPVANQTPDHELTRWLARWMMALWNRMADLAEPAPELFSDPQVQRGAYLTNNLGHCGECHTPRNSLGILDASRKFTGSVMGESEPDAIDSEALSGWSEEDFAFFLFLGIKPDDEFVGGEMEAVIEHNTSKLTDEDRQAMAAYFIRGQ